MMTTISDDLAASLLALMTGDDLSVGLHSADPGRDGASEISGVARAAIPPGDWSAYVTAEIFNLGQQTTNSLRVQFAGATGSATVSHISLWSGGTFWIGEALGVPVPIEEGDEPFFDVGALVLAAVGVSLET